MNCSLRSSAAEMPLPVRKGEKNQAISWESWGQLIPAVGAWAARHFPWVQLAAQGDPQVPLGWGALVAPRSLEVVCACGLFLWLCCYCSCMLNSPAALVS